MAKDKICKPFLAISTDKFTVDTIEDLKVAKRFVLGDVVEVLGFHTKGDGSHHKRIAKSEDDGSGEEGQGGIWWCVVHSGEINVSWFGAKGDGITDDTDAIQKALVFIARLGGEFKGKVNVTSNSTKINKTVYIASNTTLDFNQNTVVSDSDEFVFSTGYLKDGLIVDNRTDITNPVIELRGVNVVNITIQNVIMRCKKCFDLFAFIQTCHLINCHYKKEVDIAIRAVQSYYSQYKQQYIHHWDKPIPSDDFLVEFKDSINQVNFEEFVFIDAKNCIKYSGAGSYKSTIRNGTFEKIPIGGVAILLDCSVVGNLRIDDIYLEACSTFVKNKSYGHQVVIDNVFNNLDCELVKDELYLNATVKNVYSSAGNAIFNAKQDSYFERNSGVKFTNGGLSRVALASQASNGEVVFVEGTLKDVKKNIFSTVREGQAHDYNNSSFNNCTIYNNNDAYKIQTRIKADANNIIILEATYNNGREKKYFYEMIMNHVDGSFNSIFKKDNISDELKVIYYKTNDLLTVNFERITPNNTTIYMQNGSIRLI